MEKVEVTKVSNGYLVTQNDAVHVCSFDSHAALGKVVAAALGAVHTPAKRKPKQVKVITKADLAEAPH